MAIRTTKFLNSWPLFTVFWLENWVAVQIQRCVCVRVNFITNPRWYYRIHPCILWKLVKKKSVVMSLVQICMYDIWNLIHLYGSKLWYFEKAPTIFLTTDIQKGKYFVFIVVQECGNQCSFCTISYLTKNWV